MRWLSVFAVAMAALPAPASAHDDPVTLVAMLRPPPHAVPAAAWREAFAARGTTRGWTVRDTLRARRAPPPWTLRVLRIEAREPLVSATGHIRARTAAAAQALALDPAVAWAEPDFVRDAAVAPGGAPWESAGCLDAREIEPHVAPAPGASAQAARSVHGVHVSLPPEPLLIDTRQWGLHNFGPGSAYGGIARADVHAAEAWAGGAAPARGSPVLLAVADTGIDPGHPEFLGADGRSRIAFARAAAEPGATIHDSLGHGTLVAGIMAAATGEGAHFDSLGMAGVCGTCGIVPIRITRGSRRTATAFDIAQAILYSADIGARAMNLSFAGGGRSRLERLALEYALARGCVVVAASGNRGHLQPQPPQYPAEYAADGLCVAVGASDSFDRRPAWSSFGPALDFIAPGQDIWSAAMTYPGPLGQTFPGYVPGSGTSFAAPFATGVAGLLAQARPDLAAADVQPILKLGAQDLGAPGPDPETGAGRLHAAAALAAVAPEIGILHDEAPAAAFRDVAHGALTIAEPGPGAFTPALSGLAATQVECVVRVALPDSFVADVRVWPRAPGTSTVRGGFDLPYHAAWSEASIDGRTIVLRGYAYRIDDGDAPERWVPLPPDQMRFAYTVTGPVARPAPAAPAAGARVLAHPNPSRGPVWFALPAPGVVSVFDLKGRRIWRGAGRSVLEWSGGDPEGRPVAPGVYLLRYDGPGGAHAGKLVRLP